jgi:hypothetical protein
MNNTTKKISVTVRLRPTTLQRLDEMRGKRSRQHMIVGAINFMLEEGLEVPPVVKPEPKAVLAENMNQEAA